VKGWASLVDGRRRGSEFKGSRTRSRASARAARVRAVSQEFKKRVV